MNTGQRLYVKIYVAFLVTLMIAVPGASLVVHLTEGERQMPPEYVRSIARMVITDISALPPPYQSARVREIGRELKIRFAIHSPSGRLLVATPLAPPLPPVRTPEGSVFHVGTGWAMAFQVDNGYWITATHASVQGGNLWRGMLFIAVFAALLFIGTYLVARRLSGRIERLQTSIAAWGGGTPPPPVSVEGNDEVAQLAKSFNDAASRIAELLAQQRHLLAAASHELRTPLARIRMAAELLAEAPDQQASDRALNDIHDDIAELDGLVADILMAARLEARPFAPTQTEPLDLADLAQEVATSYDITFHAEPVTVMGNHASLKRLIANLVDNARKYGAPPVTITVTSQKEEAILTVADRGPGVSVSAVADMFTPFYRNAPATVEGYGLGLALVQKIAERHGGMVRYRDRDGGGAIFELSLPRINTSLRN